MRTRHRPDTVEPEASGLPTSPIGNLIERCWEARKRPTDTTQEAALALLQSSKADRMPDRYFRRAWEYAKLDVIRREAQERAALAECLTSGPIPPPQSPVSAPLTIDERLRIATTAAAAVRRRRDVRQRYRQHMLARCLAKLPTSRRPGADRCMLLSDHVRRIADRQYTFCATADVSSVWAHPPESDFVFQTVQRDRAIERPNANELPVSQPVVSVRWKTFPVWPEGIYGALDDVRETSRRYEQWLRVFAK